MGLRGKIISLFFIGFGLMNAIVITLLYFHLQRDFVEIEHKQATEQMFQLAHNFNNELDRLNQVNSDWANWDDMYNFAQQHNQSFTDHQIGAAALQTIELKFVYILDNYNNTLFSIAINLVSGKIESSSPFDNVIDNVKQRLKHPETGRTCGLDVSTVGTLLVCWQPIRQTNHTGADVGVLIMGQLIDNNMLKRIHTQSNLNFELNLLPIRTVVLPVSQKSTVEPEGIEFDTNQTNVLNAYLNNIVGRPILEVHLPFSNEVSQHGNVIIWEIIREILIVIVLIGITLFIGVHFIVIRRLRKIEMELTNIWRNGRWAERLDTNKSKDELNGLTRSINRMLSLIRKQMGILETTTHTDSLTQIPNQRSFDQRLVVEMSLHKRNQTPLSILMLDVDYFKQYNDYYGHPAGDEMLKKIGKLLNQIACRPSDLPARIDGGKFAVILPNTDLEGAHFVAEKLIAKLAEQQIPHIDSFISDFVTISIGITVAGDEDVVTFLQRLDKALYNAKHTGRNKICVLHPDESTH